jgi:predicted amidohydrolase YtcJ
MRTLYRAGALYGADPSVTALVVEGDTIAWIGTADAADTLTDGVDHVLDVPEALITPAFVDAHAHVTETGLQLIGVNLSGVRSLGELLGMVEAAARSGGGRPVLGHGWDEGLLAERRPPTRSELDRAAAGGVVYLSRVDAHSAVISSALAHASSAPDLPGWDADGRVEREAHHAARDATRGALSSSARREAQLVALHAGAAQGIAAVHEMSAPHIAPEADLRELIRLSADPGMHLPQVIAYRGQLVGDVEEARHVLARLGPGIVGLAGDLCVDGSVGSRTAAYREVYADGPGARGHLYLTVEQVRDHVAACTLAGVQAGFHAIGDAAVDTVRRGVRRAAEKVGIAAVRAAGHRVEHVESIDADGIADLADLRLVASVQPAFDAQWGGRTGMYASRLGPSRALAMNPFGALASAGVPLALGSDSPITPFDPWGAVRACARHHVPAQRIDADAAFSAHTRGGWRAAGRSDAGVLAVGAPADLAAWTTNDGAVRPRLPDLSDGTPAPVCVLTVGRGRILHDGR